jgi:hypothetical protein
MIDDDAHGVHDYVADPRNADILISVNGELKKRDEAVVSVFDSGYILGDGVWEGLRVMDIVAVHIRLMVTRGIKKTGPGRRTGMMRCGSPPVSDHLPVNGRFLKARRLKSKKRRSRVTSASSNITSRPATRTGRSILRDVSALSRGRPCAGTGCEDQRPT